MLTSFSPPVPIDLDQAMLGRAGSMRRVRDVIDPAEIAQHQQQIRSTRQALCE
jgi:hypothetical protein